MRRRRFAKIIATLGPATSSPGTIRSLFAAGVDVFRLNFSHGDHDGHRRCFEAIRAVGVTGTPAIVLESGEIVPGYVPPEELAQMLDERVSG